MKVQSNLINSKSSGLEVLIWIIWWQFYPKKNRPLTHLIAEHASLNSNILCIFQNLKQAVIKISMLIFSINVPESGRINELWHVISNNVAFWQV